MTEQSEVPARPRLWLRLIFVFLLIFAIVAPLAYIKFGQIQQQIAQGSQPPPPISVNVSGAVPADWKRRVRAIGTLVAFQGVNITTEVSGIVKSINFASGDEVSKDRLLVELDNSTEKANLESAQAQYDSDNSQYQRLLKLKDQSFVTSNDIDTQASLVNVSNARVSVAQTALAKKRIYAPFTGKLGISQVDIGEYVPPGQTIVTLLSLDRLYLDFTLPEDNFNDLEINQQISFKVRSYPDRRFSAHVETWNPELDENTRNIRVRAIVDNRERLLAPGMFADMELSSKRKLQVLAVPETAIFYNIYGEAVYVLESAPQGDSAAGSAENTDQPDYRLAARQVRIAYRNDGMAGIVEGINADDQVVIAGQLKLYPGLKVAIVDDVPDYSGKTSE